MVGTKGFRHTIKDKALTLSWRTDRVSSTDLTAYNIKLQSAMKQMGMSDLPQ